MRHLHIQQRWHQSIVLSEGRPRWRRLPQSRKFKTQTPHVRRTDAACERKGRTRTEERLGTLYTGAENRRQSDSAVAVLARSRSALQSQHLIPPPFAAAHSELPKHWPWPRFVALAAARIAQNGREVGKRMPLDLERRVLRQRARSTRCAPP